ncbi:MAG: diguanylate cyclase [Alphaproteobacteria bacterium]|nr:diguanylate cyclase [Alphaproteobacteria bacterium]
MFLRNAIGTLLLVVLLLFGTSLPARALDLKLGSVVPNEQERTDEQALREGEKLLAARKPAQAVEEFRKVTAGFEEKYRDSREKHFCARNRDESQVYMSMAQPAGADISILPMTWALASFLEGYALIEAGRTTEARGPLARAVALSPMNAQFLSELGHLQQLDRNWPAALATFQRAEEAVRFSAQEVRKVHLSRALRGQGYTFVEMHRLEDAERAYRKCLRIDPGDRKARSELAFVQKLRGRLRRS